MFLSDSDYTTVIGDDAFKTVARLDPAIRQRAETLAVGEISSYLRPDFDVAAIFSELGDMRDPVIVMITVDIALYNLFSAMPQRLGSEIRKERYDRAIRWLEGVQKGAIVPDLPPAVPLDDADTGPTTSFFSNPKLRHDW